MTKQQAIRLPVPEGSLHPVWLRHALRWREGDRELPDSACAGSGGLWKHPRGKHMLPRERSVPVGVSLWVCAALPSARGSCGLLWAALSLLLDVSVQVLGLI